MLRNSKMDSLTRQSVLSPSLSKVVLECACLNHAGVVLAVVRLTKQNVLPHRP
jgi:hypothetical protein